MIYSLSGKLVHTESDLAVIECAGVGYACKTTFSTLQQIAGKKRGQAFTHLAVKEDAVELFGFATKEELKSFRMLISVSGVGPKAGLAILSACTPSQFALAVATGDTKAFTKIKGIGTKIAQRIVLELKDKVAKREYHIRQRKCGSGLCGCSKRSCRRSCHSPCGAWIYRGRSNVSYIKA